MKLKLVPRQCIPPPRVGRWPPHLRSRLQSQRRSLWPHFRYLDVPARLGNLGTSRPASPASPASSFLSPRPRPLPSSLPPPIILMAQPVQEILLFHQALGTVAHGCLSRPPPTVNTTHHPTQLSRNKTSSRFNYSKAPPESLVIAITSRTTLNHPRSTSFSWVLQGWVVPPCSTHR
ncbi:hypothetical protein BD779DRAFT_431869 [Infundibulicybe gibba]|nr:hypothetical protein BD779DRAFT_431869 [Infundibulicybe gibba]